MKSIDQHIHEAAIAEAHAQGQKDEAEGKGWVEQTGQRCAYAVAQGSDVAAAYDAGVENARNNPPQK
jgi:hypothetical protein